MLVSGRVFFRIRLFLSSEIFSSETVAPWQLFAKTHHLPGVFTGIVRPFGGLLGGVLVLGILYEMDCDLGIHSLKLTWPLKKHLFSGGGVALKGTCYIPMICIFSSWDSVL